MQPTNDIQKNTLTYGTSSFALNFEFQDEIADQMFPQDDSRRSLTDSDDMYLDNFNYYGMSSFMFLYVLIS